jgi:redox-sensitive bicupin YhaK (pirin superfamily)
MGFRDRLGPHDAQFIRAGRGIIHAEQPQGGRHGLQLWISLPPELKMVEPTYTSIRATDIPTITHKGSQLYVVAGLVNGTQGPMALSGGAIFARLQLDAHANAKLEVAPAPELGIYVLQGKVIIGEMILNTGDLGMLSSGSSLDIKALGDEAVELALLGGLPVQGEVLFSGPFVMDTAERLAQAKKDFLEGRMGQLEGVPF